MDLRATRMKNTLLTSISPIDGRYSKNTKSLQNIASEYGLIKYRIIIEIQWLKILADHPVITEIRSLSPSAIKFLDEIIENFSPDEAQKVKEIEETTNHDVKAVEYYLKEKVSSNPELFEISEFFHFACTSEDINNLSYALMLRDMRENVILPSLLKVLDKLKKNAHQLANISMLSHTHGQPASPTTVGKEFANIHARLNSQTNTFQNVKLLGKINGAVGNYNAHIVAYPEIDWEKVSSTITESLGLVNNPYTTQIEPHDYIAEYCDALSRINTIFIDMCRDIWAYISIEYFKQKVIEGEIGSSTMPHKVNPIDFENAEGNFGIANALLRHFSEKLPISRWQRDLSDSTVLRNLGVAIAHSEIGYQSLLKGMSKIEINITQIRGDLENNTQVLAEAIQTILRKYKVEGAYEKLKELTRGQDINEKQLSKFINSIDLPDHEKDKLHSLSSSSYIGNAINKAKST